jgi:hypothetical protein
MRDGAAQRAAPFPRRGRDVDSLKRRTEKPTLVAALVLAAGIAGVLASGCGSSAPKTEVSLPTITAPNVSMAPAPDAAPAQTAQTATDTAPKAAQENGKQAKDLPSSSDQAKARGGGSSTSHQAPSAGDAARAKNPGANGGGGSPSNAASDQQRAGG